MVNAGAVDLVEATVAAGAVAGGARKWWLGELARRANEAGVELADAGRSPRRRWRELQALVDAGTLNDKLARQVLEGVLAGEGDPDEVVAARPGVVSGRRRADRGRRRGDRGQPRRGRQDPRRQGRGGRGAGRRGHEGDPKGQADSRPLI